MKRRSLALLLALVMMLGLLAGCGGGDADAGNTDGGNTASGNDPTGNPGGNDPNGGSTYERKTDPDSFIWGAIEEPSTLEPAANAISTGHVITNCIFDTLVVRDYVNGGFKNVLAESVEYVDETYTTLEIKLRDGISFTNGEPLTADDVLFTLERLSISPRSSTNFACVDFDNTEVVDDLTILVKLHEPYAPLISYLAGTGAGLMNRDYFNSVSEEEFSRNPVGTGAFKFVDWVAGSTLTLERNDDYWGQKPAYSKLVIRFIAESTTRFIELETGNIDACGDLNGLDMDRVMNGEVPGVNLYTREGQSVVTLEMNKKNELLNDKNIRLAIAHAVDWEALVESVYGTGGVIGTSIFGPTMLYHEPAGVYEYNPELSKQLLAEAGYPDGGITFTSCMNAGRDLQSLEIIQEYLRQIGITLNIEVVDFGTMISQCVAGEVDICISDMGASNDPEQSISNSAMDSGFQIARINDEYLQSLYNDGTRTADPEAREKIYHEIAHYYFDECVRIPFCFTTAGFATRDYVLNFEAPASGTPDLRYITFA